MDEFRWSMDDGNGDAAQEIPSAAKAVRTISFSARMKPRPFKAFLLGTVFPN
jgi:hypothetical protein